MPMDLQRTEKQELRAARNQKIADRYRALRAEYPTAPEARIFAEIAKDYSVGAPQIRYVLKSMGVC